MVVGSEFIFGSHFRGSIENGYKSQDASSCEISCSDGTIMVDENVLSMTSGYFAELIDRAQNTRKSEEPIKLDQTMFSRSVVKVQPVHFTAKCFIKLTFSVILRLAVWRVRQILFK